MKLIPQLLILCALCAVCGAPISSLGAVGDAGIEAAPAPSAAPPPRPRPPLRVATLSNGLRLLCRTNDSSEIVSVVCLVRAGLPDERDTQAGLAALTGEMLLKGTTTHPGRSFEHSVIRAGGNLRVTPGFDFTEISVVTGKDQFEPALKLVADVVAHPRFAPEDLAGTIETLRRRTAALQDNFTGATYETLVGQLYPSSPYGRPVNGYSQSLAKLGIDDIKQFWKKNYVQNRMVVGIVGDVDSGRALDLAQKAFKSIPFDLQDQQERPTIQTLGSPKVEVIQRAAPMAQLMVGYLAPGATRANYPVHALIDGIVGGGKRARLFSNIRQKHSLGYELGSFYQPLRHQSHLVGYVVTPPARRNPRTEQQEGLIDLVKGHLLEQYRQLSAAGPTDAELARAKAYVIGRYALRQERTRDQAKWLAWNEGMGLGKDFDQYFTTRIQSLTKEEVQAAAKRALGTYALVVTLPRVEG